MDIIFGKFVFFCIEVYKIEKGKVGVLVKGVMLIGNGLDVLICVIMIGNDMVFDLGMGICGK